MLPTRSCSGTGMFAGPCCSLALRGEQGGRRDRVPCPRRRGRARGEYEVGDRAPVDTRFRSGAAADVVAGCVRRQSPATRVWSAARRPLASKAVAACRSEAAALIRRRRERREFAGGGRSRKQARPAAYADTASRYDGLTRGRLLHRLAKRSSDRREVRHHSFSSLAAGEPAMTATPRLSGLQKSRCLSESGRFKGRQASRRLPSCCRSSSHQASSHAASLRGQRAAAP